MNNKWTRTQFVGEQRTDSPEFSVLACTNCIFRCRLRQNLDLKDLAQADKSAWLF